MVCLDNLHFKPCIVYWIISGDMDQALPVPIPRHFVKQYGLVNSNLTYIEMPRTGHTATSKCFL